MPKNYDAKNTSGSKGKVNNSGPKQPKCSTCADNRQVRVSKPRINTKLSPARQQYDIVTERCPDCK